MPKLTLSDEQVIELVKQLPPESKRVVLLALAKEGEQERDSRMEYAQTQLRNLCAERGLDWDSMTEDERESFIDDLVHEDMANGIRGYTDKTHLRGFQIL